METIITAENVKKSFQKHTVLDQLELHVQKGEFLAIVGASGCGKSTLLNILGLLDRQDEGDIILFGEKNIRPFYHQAQVLLKEKIGYLFQNYALLEDKSIAYNLEIVFSGRMKREEKRQRIMEALEAVGLKGMEKKKVCQCSGGEQQRAAMARLLLKPCELILADEPTSNLDPQNKEKVYELLKEMNVQGKTVIIVTHDMELAKRCDRILVMDEGKLSTAA